MIMPRPWVIAVSLLVLFLSIKSGTWTAVSSSIDRAAASVRMAYNPGDSTPSFSPGDRIAPSILAPSPSTTAPTPPSARAPSSRRREVPVHQKAGFRLNESHTKVGCTACHPKRQRTGGKENAGKKKENCGFCHGFQHDLPAGLTCTMCHSLESFSRINDYRHLLNDFWRVGVHRTLSCRECHPDLRFKGTPRECVYCHVERRQDAPPPHGLKLGNDCQQCHSPYGWQPVKFQHPGFILGPAHRSLNCLDCHPGYEFTNVQPYCYSCHKREFHGLAGFDHAAAGLPYDCRKCHSLYAFTAPVSYRDHQSGLITQGRHKSAACLDCHRQRVFYGLSGECRNCHQKDYNAAKNPNHASSGFPLDCTLCHESTDFSWESGWKDHLWWPLQGMHALQSCIDCHRDGVYAGKSPLCVSCHQSDYAGAKEPDHQAIGLPTSCDQCHRDSHTSWNQATFNHPLPLTAQHAGIGCTECHKEPGNFAAFVCTDCHLRQNTSPLHRGVSGYSYDSQSCYYCHPQGQS
ncbi:MAG: cytochrome c3 family protein [bacterium]